jgi:beta-fructofuranosidase
VEAAPFKLAAGETLKLRVFLDRSFVEAFANARQAVLRRAYPSLPESKHVVLYSKGGAARVLKASWWRLAPTNPH